MGRTKFIIEKVANMIFLSSLDGDDKPDTIFRTWDEEEFTERKLKNAMKNIQANYQYEVEFIRTF